MISTNHTVIPTDPFHCVGTFIPQDLIYTSRRVSGQEGADIGLVNAVEDTAELALKRAKETCLRIAQNGPLGVRGAKTVIDASYGLEISEATELSMKFRESLTHTNDFNEALRAFVEKNRPVFTGT